MVSTKAYEELIDFIVAGMTPRDVISFRPSEETQKRVNHLIEQEKNATLAPAEKSELDHYVQLEHIMRLAKARARRRLAHE
jgi:hypothetical protein